MKYLQRIFLVFLINKNTMTTEDKITKIDTLKAQIDAFGKIPVDILKKINYKFRLEWNYHSNKMEGGTLTKDETRNVMIGIIDVQGKPLKDVFEMSGHDNMVLDVLKMAKGEVNISEKRILELHKAIMYEENPENQNKIGKWKILNNEVMNYRGEKFTFVPVSEVKDAMHNLTNWLNTEIDKIKSNQKAALNPALLAFEFHLRYVNIHPFYDGNGRTGRILMNIILVAFGYPPIIIKTGKRDIYFKYLADIQCYNGDKNLYFGFMLDLLYESLELINNAIQGKNIDEEDDLDKKLALLKISLQTQEEATKRTQEIVANLINVVMINDNLNSFIYKTAEVVDKFRDFFTEISIKANIDNDIHLDFTKRYEEIEIWQAKIAISDIYAIFLNLRFKGFKKAGTNAFDVDIRVDFAFEEYFYTISFKDKNHIIKKLYHQLPTTSEIETFAKIIGNAIYDEIEQKLNQEDKK